MKPEKTTGDTWWSDINVRDIAAVKRTLDNNISSVVEAAYASPIHYSAGRIKRHGHSVETVSEKWSQLSGWRLQLIDILLVIVSYQQVVGQAVVKRPCDTHHNWCSTVQDAQLSQRDCTVRYRFGKKWKTGTGTQHFTDIIGLSSTTVI